MIFITHTEAPKGAFFMIDPDRAQQYGEWIRQARARGMVGDEAWGRWIAEQYRFQAPDSNTGCTVSYPMSNKTPVGESLTTKSNSFDKKAYQREYMRKKRGKGD